MSILGLMGRGAAAGFAATLPMTLVMVALHRALPRQEQYALPPKLITEELTETSGMAEDLSPEEINRITVANHFAYGAAVAVPYAVLASRIPGPRLGLGIGYGLAVWAGSYLGWLPATGLLRPATEHPPRRTGMMIAAHIVYGAALAWLVEGMGAGRRRESMRERAEDALAEAGERIRNAAGHVADDLAEAAAARLERLRA
jgi:uncharacterized membrane protein YagU involved in acid resistance